jgi:Zn-dependent M16 (insulinase) family peptidase
MSNARRKTPGGTRRTVFILAAFLTFLHATGISASKSTTLAGLTRDQVLFDFRVTNLYSGTAGQVVGAKFRHVPTGAPVYVFQRETVPQAYLWVDTPATSNQGEAHALEHLLVGKGTKGRYSTLLREMTLSASCAATYQDYNYYCFSSGAGLGGFYDQLHAWLEALYHPDFTDSEAEREFYHFGVITDAAAKQKTLIEKGTVYAELELRQDIYSYYFASIQKTLGKQNPFGFDHSGTVNEMRGVTPPEILRFHEKHYHIGPTTGFIFVVSPKENLSEFLSRVSTELRMYSKPSIGGMHASIPGPKYPIDTLSGSEATIHKFPSASETVPGEVLFGWSPVENRSMADLKLLQLFLRVLAQGEHSLLYKSLVDSKTREFDSNATRVTSTVFLANSPNCAVPQVFISGIPGNRISVTLIDQLRALALKKIRDVAGYADQSDDLIAFNKMVLRDAQTEHRSEMVWTKSPPLFGISESPYVWKEYLEYLEMDPTFERSLSEEPVWRAVAGRLKSGKNIWRDLIDKFRLRQVPAATASVPSAELRADIEKTKRDRVKQEIETLVKRYQAVDEQEALARFEQDELGKTRAIDEISTNIARPRFTDHPPLTPDDHIRYRQFEMRGVPVVASLFDDPPTIDIGFSFDLTKIPRRYYKFLPLLPRCLDSLGLKEEGKTLSYSDLLAETQAQAYQFSIDYPYDLRGKKAELRIQASAADEASFRRVLLLIERMMRFNFLESSNIDRLRDIVEQDISADQIYTRQAELNWLHDPVYAFRNLDSPLFLAVNSHFTKAHWNARLKWLLHQPVAPQAIDDLAEFADRVLASKAGLSRKELSEALDRINAVGLETELVQYWRQNLASFPESGLADGFQQLTLEVQQDLRAGPATIIEDLRELQRLVLNRNALRIDLTIGPKTLDHLQPHLMRFVKSIPPQLDTMEPSSTSERSSGSMEVKREDSGRRGGPLYVGFVDPDAINGDAYFLADFPGYFQLDHESLVQTLSSELLAGAGPQSLFMKTWEAGLAYDNGIDTHPDTRLVEYYADRIPDVPALIEFVNVTAQKIDRLNEDKLVDYALSGIFSFSREMLPLSKRGRELANDIRDGVQPDKLRRFSEAILEMRRDTNLASDLKRAGLASICGVLLLEDCRPQQAHTESTFFFIGSEKILTEAEKRLSISGLRRLYPHDYWIP